MTRINFDLLGQLAVRSHPLLNPLVCDCHHWCGEINQEAKVSHHLLDLAGIAHGEGYAQHLDARTYQAVAQLVEAREQLGRIAAWHHRLEAPGGMHDDICAECGHPWPCETNLMADGVHEDLAA